MIKRDFERKFRGRYEFKDPDYVDELWKEFRVDLRDAGEDRGAIEDVFGFIDRRVHSYNSGRARGHADMERGQTTRNARIDEEVAIRPPAGTYEMTRAEALSEYIAKVASADAVTRRYRERVLGRRLTAEEARAFLSSPVSATVPINVRPRARLRSVSFLEYEIGEQAEDDSGPYKLLRYRHAERNREVKLRPVLRVFRRGDSVLAYPGDTISPDELWQHIPRRNASEILLRIPSGDSVVAMSRSALDTLADQASKLARMYLLEPESAAWFILTGERPEPKYMSAKLSSLYTDELSRAVLTLTVEPWVPPETLKAYYQEIRNSVVDGSGGARDRTIAVFRFVVSHMEVEGATLKHPEWKSLAELWNEMYPEDHPWYFADYRDFRRSYMRGRDAIAFTIFR